MTLNQTASGRERTEKCIFWLLFACLALWPLCFVNKGVDIYDTFYYLSHYKWAMDAPRLFDASLGFSNLTGSLIYHLLPSHQLLVFRLLDVFVNWTVFWCIYRMVGKKQNSLLLLGMLAGSFFLKRYPMALSYNSFTVLFLALAMLALLKGLEKEKPLLVAVSGALAGISVLYRLPNLLQSTIILAIPLYGLLSGWSWKRILKDCLWFVLGYFAFLLLGLLILVGIQGLEATLASYWDMVELGSDGTEGNDHNLWTMLVKTYSGLHFGVRAPLKTFAAAVLASAALTAAGKYLFHRDGESRSQRAVLTGCAILVGLCFGAVLLKKFWDEDGHEYYAACCHAMALACLTGAAAVLCLRKVPASVAVLGLFTGASVFYMALGTDNALYQFTIFGGAILGLSVYLLSQFMELCTRTKGKTASLLAPHIRFACLSVMTLILTECLVEGAWFLPNETYRDEKSNLLTTAANVPEVAGVKTTVSRAQILEGISRDFQEPGFAGFPLAISGSFIPVYTLTDNVPFFPTIWPELISYSEDDFRDTLLAGEEQGVLPIMLVEPYATFEDCKGSYKLQLLMDVARRNDYRCVSRQSGYQILVPPECFEKMENPVDLGMPG